ncbi:NAD binding Rossmann fold oxidoreductase, putative [Talaromyces stipitatus ATCC 10500]|uniref:NAD binding Rossmann fold oxidoreductase, putative n=1 Tax=Talaromyces stipitatus (strain ATCC 10500 / CBS 375.48 / QM 6759 / NRRL 1006) TaxID=441959 RepID=B8MR48_TALSN|nr:NAD binding Rossmann fold oxidoreductase, putative [Talaromyces stipitatus ATCC 10500]EED12943.1 NAD binding Rossmann fold oxidoreductase, putative [Talaromyces stipitatus ATCC 10500]
MVTKTWNVGLIGYGFSAKIFHLPFIQSVPELKLYAIVQRNPTPENDAEKDHPGIKSYRSADELVKDANVDVIVITTPPDGHFELTKKALEAGKHVVVEKPFVPTYKEAEELVAVAQKNNKLLAVYQNRRYDADYVTLSKLVKNGSLGRVVEYETHFDRHRPEIAPNSTAWKLQGVPYTGAIYDLGAHLLDQAVHLFGLPQRITGFVGSQRANNPTGLEDSFTALLHYDKGLLVTAKAGVVSPEEKQLRFWVRGDKGSFRKFHVDIQEEQLKAGLRPGDSGYGLEPSDRYGVLTTIDQNGKPSAEKVPTVEGPTWVEYYRKLARALAGESELPASGYEASQVIRLIELARESSKSGRTLDV